MYVSLSSAFGFLTEVRETLRLEVILRELQSPG